MSGARAVHCVCEDRHVQALAMGVSMLPTLSVLFLSQMVIAEAEWSLELAMKLIGCEWRCEVYGTASMAILW